MHCGSGVGAGGALLGVLLVFVQACQGVLLISGCDEMRAQRQSSGPVLQA
jgi:hypothetical protein